MSENLRLFTKALYNFDHVVRLTPATSWENASPCEGWTARHVVGHVVAIQRYIEATVKGVTPTLNPMQDPDRHAEGDPAGVWAAARDDVLEALDHPGIITKMVTTYRGQESIDDLIGFNVIDTTIHSWDLAKAASVSDALDPSLVSQSLQLVEPIADSMRGFNAYGPRVDTRLDAPVQTQLLGLVGRRA